jgi:poly(3-hydroxybutyrate) depolymerase
MSTSPTGSTPDGAKSKAAWAGEYTAYLIEFLEFGPGERIGGHAGRGSGVMAAAVMAAHDHPSRPRTMSLLAGPIDIRAGRNIMNRISENYPMPLMRKLLIHPVPAGYPGTGRKVYPGMQQLAGFMWLNPLTHVKSNIRFIRDLALARGKMPRVAASLR